MLHHVTPQDNILIYNVTKALIKSFAVLKRRQKQSLVKAIILFEPDWNRTFLKKELSWYSNGTFLVQRNNGDYKELLQRKL